MKEARRSTVARSKPVPTRVMLPWVKASAAKALTVSLETLLLARAKIELPKPVRKAVW